AAPSGLPSCGRGGVGRGVAEAGPADPSNAPPPAASLANSRLELCDSCVLISKLRSNGCLDVGLRAAEIGEIPYYAGEPGPRARIVEVVGRVRRRQIGTLIWQVMTVEPKTQLQTLALGHPTLRRKKLHPIKAGGLHY